MSSFSRHLFKKAAKTAHIIFNVTAPLHLLTPRRAPARIRTEQLFCPMSALGIFLYGILIGAVTVGGIVFLFLMLRQKRNRPAAPPPSPFSFSSKESSAFAPFVPDSTPPPPQDDVLFVRGDFNVPRTAQQKGAWSKLPPRQKEAAIKIAEGKSTRQVAAEMCIEMSTVRGYLKEIYDALDVRSRSELTIFVRDMALVERAPTQHPDPPN